MKLPGLKVLKPGILTLVQDLGRFAYQHIGLTVLRWRYVLVDCKLRY